MTILLTPITQDGIQQLLDQMYQHGHLISSLSVDDGGVERSVINNSAADTGNDDDNNDNNDDDDDSFEAWRDTIRRRQQQLETKDEKTNIRFNNNNNNNNNNNKTKMDRLLIPTTTNQSYYTSHGLCKAIVSILTTTTTQSNDDDDTIIGGDCNCNGRMTVSDIASKLNIMETTSFTECIMNIITEENNRQTNHNDNNNNVSSTNSGSSKNGAGNDDDDNDGRMKLQLLTIGGTLEVFASPYYWDNVWNNISQQLTVNHDDSNDRDEGKSLPILDLSKQYNLPVDIIKSYILSSNRIKNKEQHKNNIILLDHSMRVVNTKYMEGLKRDAQTFFSSQEEPIHILEAFQRQDDKVWDLQLLMDWIDNDEEFRTSCAGEFHTDNLSTSSSSTSSSSSSLFVPAIYQSKQHKLVFDYISVNGYITSDRAHQIHGVTGSDLVHVIMEKYGTSATVLTVDDNTNVSSNSNNRNSNRNNNKLMTIIVLDHFLQSIRIAVLEYLDTTSPSSSSSSAFSTTDSEEYLDLQEYIPPELMQSARVVSRLLSEAGLTPSALTAAGGMSIVVNENSIIVKNESIQNIVDKVIPETIQEFAIMRADQLYTTATSNAEGDDDDDDADLLKPKRGRKGGKKKHDKSHKKDSKGTISSSTTGGIVPLQQVARRIIQDFPTVFPPHFVESYDESRLDETDMEWDTVQIAEGDGHYCDDESNDLLVAFCRGAMYTDQLGRQCEDAVNAELKRLQSERQSKATISRKDAASKVRSVEAAFEEVFTDLCLLVQAQAKAFRYFDSLQPTSTTESQNEDRRSFIDGLKDELLRGPCADLTSRMTQHALFKEEQDFPFTFVPSESIKSNDEIEDMGGLPGFCSEINVASMDYPKTYLSCPPPRDPLPCLRESFSGNIGIALARQWTYCGGHCYQGGTFKSSLDDGREATADDTPDHVRPGNIDDFLSHLEVNSLTTCGLPLKKLDKKSEKNFLFSRKQQLLDMLVNDATMGPSAVLEVSLMLLYQQVKQLFVSGSYLKTSILDCLVMERKIPSIVGRALQIMREDINSNTIDIKLVSFIKECASCRDVSKYDTSALQEYLDNERS